MKRGEDTMKRNVQYVIFLICILTIFMVFTCADAKEIYAHNAFITTHIIESERIVEKVKQLYLNYHHHWY